MFEWTIILIISGLLIVSAIILLTGYGSMLIKGYNTMPKEEREKYNAKALSRFIGIIVLPIGLMMPFLGIESIRNWYVWVFVTVTIALVIFATIYLYKSGKYKK